MRKFGALALLFGCGVLARAQVSAFNYVPGQAIYPGYQQWDVNSAGATMPTTATTVTNAMVYLNVIQCNTGGTADTITLTDAVSGAPIWRSIAIAANSTYGYTFGGRRVPGGVKWQSSAGSVVCWLQGGN